MYSYMYFDIKQNHDPNKNWIPGYSIDALIQYLIQKFQFSSYIEIHNQHDIEKFVSVCPNLKVDVIYINSIISGMDLTNLIESALQLISDNGYVLIDRMFPYYPEFNNDQYKSFIKCRQDTRGFQYNTIWDCSYGVGIIRKGEEQYAVYNIQDAMLLDFDGFKYFFGLCMNPISMDDFINNFTGKSKYKYAVITAIFDDYEMVREVQNPNPNIEYVLVTDDPSITSNTWKVKLIDSFFDGMSGYAKAAYVKYHPFEFIDSDIFLWIDGSIQIKDDFTEEIMKPFIESNFEVLELVNMIYHVGDYEVERWYENGFHGFDKEQYNFIKNLFKDEPWIDESQVQTTIYGGKNTKICNLVNCRTWDIMRRGSGPNHDVAILYMPQRGRVLAKYIGNSHKLYLLDSGTVFSKYFDYCYHKSTESQKPSWDGVNNNLYNDLWGNNENLLYPKQITKS